MVALQLLRIALKLVILTFQTRNILANELFKLTSTYTSHAIHYSPNPETNTAKCRPGNRAANNATLRGTLPPTACNIKIKHTKYAVAEERLELPTRRLRRPILTQTISRNVLGKSQTETESPRERYWTRKFQALSLLSKLDEIGSNHDDIGFGITPTLSISISSAH